MIEGFDHREGKSNGPHSFTDLFSSGFMQQYTQFKSIEELLSSGGFEINSAEDYEAIPDEEIDAYVAKTTKFKTWKEMLTNAIEDSFTINKSGFIS